MMKVFNVPTIGLSLIGLTFAAPVFAHSSEIRCGTTYVVERADSLSNISEWAYGTAREADRIYQENIDVIGSNPSNIDIGMELQIPCLADGAEAAAEAEAVAAAEAPTTEETAAPMDTATDAAADKPALEGNGASDTGDTAVEATVNQ